MSFIFATQPVSQSSNRRGSSSGFIGSQAPHRQRPRDWDWDSISPHRLSSSREDRSGWRVPRGEAAHFPSRSRAEEPHEPLSDGSEGTRASSILANNEGVFASTVQLCSQRSETGVPLPGNSVDKYCSLLKNRVYLERSHRYADECFLSNYVSRSNSRSEHSSIRRATVFRWSCSLSRWCILLSKDNSMSVFLLSFVLFILLAGVLGRRDLFSTRYRASNGNATGRFP